MEENRDVIMNVGKRNSNYLRELDQTADKAIDLIFNNVTT